MATLKEDFLAQGMEFRETHISEVFLTPDTVYKVKKPVQLGFLDFSTPELRHQFCMREVELNRRLAHDVYRRVVPITRDAQGRHALDGAGGASNPVDWAIEMRRLPDAHAADARLRSGRLERGDLAAIAERLASFHAQARCDDETSHYGSTEAIEQNVRENFEQTVESALRFLSADELGAIERWQRDFLARERERFAARVAHGRSRDGHGDLRLEHCYIDATGAVEIIDCIEFNDRFRYGDVCADIAFLAMDLAWHERPDLSEAVLAFYARAADDYDLYGVVDFYESYRAYVRGKVNGMLHDDPAVEQAVRSRAAAQARKYYLLAEACTREALEWPKLYAIGGVIGSGKSSVADQLFGLCNAPVIEADRVRKRSAGVDPNTPWHDAAFSGHYTTERTHAVYAELLRRAEVVLRSGRSVILDASFRERAQRTAARALAERLAVPFRFIECWAPPDVCKGRLTARAQENSTSDGRLEVFDDFVNSFEAIDELAAEQHVHIDTTSETRETRERLRELVSGALAGVRGLSGS